MTQPCLQKAIVLSRDVILLHGGQAMCWASTSAEGAARKTWVEHNLMFHSNKMEQTTYGCFKIHFMEVFLRGPKHYLELASHTKPHPVPWRKKKVPVLAKWQLRPSQQPGHLCLARLNGFSPKGFRAHDKHGWFKTELAHSVFINSNIHESPESTLFSGKIR